MKASAMTWPQRTDEIETRQWTIEDLREGDLVFGQKAGGALVTLCRLAEEPWLHVGSVVADGDELKVVEIRGDRFLLTELSSFFGPGRYVEWGAARLRVQEPCWHGANEWMCSHLSGDNGENTGTQVYAWDDLILAGVMSATRRGLLAKYPDQVRSAIATAGSYCKESLEYRGRRRSRVLHSCNSDMNQWVAPVRSNTPAGAARVPRAGHQRFRRSTNSLS